jgi:serine protease Do
LDGDVIGVNTLIYSPTGTSVGISFSIPSTIAERVVGQLIEYGETRRGYLGLSAQRVTSEIAESIGMDRPRGALVRSITDGGPADAAGLEIGDIVLRFDGLEIADDRVLSRLAAEAEIGQRVAIEVLRRGENRTLTATIARRIEARDEPDRPASPSDDEIPSDQIFGLTLAELNPASRRRFRVHPDAEGVLIVAVDPLSDAAGKARAGDVIEEIAYTRVETLDEATSLLDAYEDGDVALFQLNRGGQFVFQSIRR